MDMLGWGARMAGRMSRMSPAGLFLMGGAAALAFPSVRHGLRSVAVMATRGVLTVSDAMQGSVAAMRENVEDIVAEARAAADEDGALMAAARTHGRRMAVGTAAGMMTVGEGLRSIVEEARSNRQATQAGVGEDEPAAMLATLGTEEAPQAEEPADEESPAPRRRRSRSQEQ